MKKKSFVLEDDKWNHRASEIGGNCSSCEPISNVSSTGGYVCAERKCHCPLMPLNALYDIS